eukprot:Hpha_TRINITY_DN9476_c0_g3::TRINITY_DN9476_c0_g3_i1::g.139259::m.139259
MPKKGRGVGFVAVCVLLACTTTGEAVQVLGVFHPQEPTAKVGFEEGVQEVVDAGLIAGLKPVSIETASTEAAIRAICEALSTEAVIGVVGPTRSDIAAPISSVLKAA